MEILSHTPPFNGDRWATAPLDELWAQEAMGDWIVALRLMDQDGHAVIAELRMFPRQLGTNQLPGRWVDEGVIPTGGIGSRDLRSVKLGNLFPAAQRELAAHFATIPVSQLATAARLGDLSFIESPLIDAGFYSPQIASHRHPAQTHPGAGGHNIDHYLWYARTYVSKVRWGVERPNHAISLERFGTEDHAEYVRKQVGKARKRGYLTAPLVNGQAGGRLTPEAREEIERIGDLRPSSFPEHKAQS